MTKNNTLMKTDAFTVNDTKIFRKLDNIYNPPKAIQNQNKQTIATQKTIRPAHTYYFAKASIHSPNMHFRTASTTATRTPINSAD
jgi:hypothetical protein